MARLLPGWVSCGISPAPCSASIQLCGSPSGCPRQILGRPLGHARGQLQAVLSEGRFLSFDYTASLGGLGLLFCFALSFCRDSLGAFKARQLVSARGATSASLSCLLCLILISALPVLSFVLSSFLFLIPTVDSTSRESSHLFHPRVHGSGSSLLSDCGCSLWGRYEAVS